MRGFKNFKGSDARCPSIHFLFYVWNDNLQSFNREKMNHRYQSFTRIGRQFQSLERQVYADWTSVSFPFCQRSCLIWRIITNTLTNTMTNTYVVIFLSVSIFGRGYHSRYQNFEFTAPDPINDTCQSIPERFAWRVEIDAS